MSKASAKKSAGNQADASSDSGGAMARRMAESAFLIILVLALYLLLALFSHDPTDPGWSRAASGSQVANLGGSFGAWLSDLFLVLFGYMAYVAPLLVGLAGLRILRERTEPASLAEWSVRTGGLLLIVLAGCILLDMQSRGALDDGGGVLGALLAGPMVRTMGFTGAALINLTILLAGITLFTGLSWIRVVDRTGRGAIWLAAWLVDRFGRLRDWFAGRRARAEREEVRKRDTIKRKTKPEVRIEPRVEPTITRPVETRHKQQPLFKHLSDSGVPPLDLLDEPKQAKAAFSEDALKAMSRQVELKLADFGVEVEVVAVHPGPVITRFELQPAPGVKGAQISNLAKDLARGLSVISVRVVDVIPGKSVIGLEIPNENREIVYLRDIFASEAYVKSSSPLTLGLGKSISGKPMTADIAKMPHLLVAGTTGSGKSVAINAMILSLLYKATPDQVRLIMVDPKMLELSVYEGIQHLLTPVVTDMKEAANALRWCVAEMERRYRLMAAVGVRNLAGFNRKIKEAIDKGEPIPDPLIDPSAIPAGEEAPTLTKLPYIVVVVDEFADMMMIVGKKVEQLIARLAQKARAAGIHLVLATQRPSVDVITGLIKANIPTRMAFQVSSRIDSRTILDQQGAEQLLGHGDMLYLPPGQGVPERIHGAFVDDHEVHGVVEWLKQQGEPDYLEDVLADTQTTSDGMTIGENGLPESSGGGDSDDELYDKAVAYVTSSRRASISSVQRQLRIGYNRAARLIEEMEAQGVVSPPEHNGQREVLAPAPPRD
ncbi:DNA translocase FtsK [Wenzhouxiangella marina]|uniref:DNA translocase FtsK n=1 Tax=Wenzhouxiangella marina TaxID=1579979 RepID=A0A0K0XVT1_9GAMM|nr:DNA translocase FtsK [Wenzhouxiangella marina]AKS41814.1 DNA segregation ATPase FtsK [Wenzhouxiangella marina]MBB6086424.1 S-DNA-T family DNA segregation ATPase FtsK/SpoIIIE [Wenzhouxiangella marina]